MSTSSRCGGQVRESAGRLRATGEARSAVIRQVTLAGPKRPSSPTPSGTADANAAAERSIRPVLNVVSVKLTSSFAGVATPASVIATVRLEPGQVSRQPRADSSTNTDRRQRLFTMGLTIRCPRRPPASTSPARRRCPSRRVASSARPPPGSPAFARWRPTALPSPHAARSAAVRRSRAGRP